MPPSNAYVPMWLRGTPLEQIYIDAWVETGNANLAIEAVRARPEYQTFFPGNQREDGTVRYQEEVYQSIVESFEDSILSIGLNPDVFSEQFPSLIEGLVSPDEFNSRINMVYTRVIDATPEVAARLNDFYGAGLNVNAVLASFMDPDLGQAILEKRVAVSEVAAEASRRRFNVTREFSEMLYEAGTDTSSEAAQFFGLAEGTLPILQGLAARHADPDDDFDLEEFAAGMIFDDARQRQRMRLLVSQEESDFARSPEPVARAQQGVYAGGLTGLAAG